MKKYVLMFLFFGFLLNFCGCFSGSEDEGEDEYKLTCKIDGVNKTFYSIGGFGLDDYDNTYNNFYDSKENDDESFSFKFPSDVAAGPYNKTSSNFYFDYHSLSEIYYDNHASSNITVTVIEWGSDNGDPIRGTFSGDLCSDSGCKTITEGTFESKLIE